VDMYDIVKGMAEIEAEGDREADLLFGDKEDCTDEEGAIIFDSRLEFKDKIAKLQVLRGS